MPSYKQIMEIWRVQQELFGSHGLPKENYFVHGQGFGLVEENNMDHPISNHRNTMFSGKCVGEMKFDAEKREYNLQISENDL